MVNGLFGAPYLLDFPAERPETEFHRRNTFRHGAEINAMSRTLNVL